MDQMILEAQKWMNTTYSGRTGWTKIEEDGKTGWDTVYALLRAFQIENGSTTPANNIGPWTQQKLLEVGMLERNDNAKPSNVVKILQGTLWCKGYVADGLTGIFGSETEKGIKKLQADIGLTETDGKLSLYLWFSLFSMDQFVMLYGGKTKVREFQQRFNNKFTAYTKKYIPCDGLAGRELFTCFAYLLQMEEGYLPGEATGFFGDATYNNCPILGINSETDKRFPETINAIKLALMLNLGKDSDFKFDGHVDGYTKNAVREFEDFMAYTSSEETMFLGIFPAIIKALYTSNGFTGRLATACDMATPIDERILNDLLSNGYKAVGRYLTSGIINGKNKQLTKEEYNLLAKSGVAVIPIYQTTGNSLDYFNYEQGVFDGNKAVELANKLGIPKGSEIYFAVDYDVLGDDIPGTVIPYFNGIASILRKSIYKPSVYGTRNVCLQVSNAGLAEHSYLADISSGYSGNLGFPAPKNWAFDQFVETDLNGTSIDKVIYRYDVKQIGDKGVIGSAVTLEDAQQQYAYNILSDINLLPAALEYELLYGKTVKMPLSPWLTVQLELKGKSSIENIPNKSVITFDEKGNLKEFEQIKTALTGFQAMTTLQRDQIEKFFNGMELKAESKSVEATIRLSPDFPARMQCVLAFNSTNLIVNNEETNEKVCLEVIIEYSQFNNLIFIDNSSLETFARFTAAAGVLILGGGLIVYTGGALAGAVGQIPSLIQGAASAASTILYVLGLAKA